MFACCAPVGSSTSFPCLQVHDSVLLYHKLFFPFNIANMHWAAICVDLHAHSLHFWDSMAHNAVRARACR